MHAPSTRLTQIDYGELALEQAYQAYIEEWREGPQAGADAAGSIFEAFRDYPDLEAVSIESDWDRFDEYRGCLASPRFRIPAAELPPVVIASVKSLLANASWALSETHETFSLGLVTSQNSAAETARCMGLHRAAAHLEAAELNEIAKSIPYQSESAASALRL